MGKRLTAKHVSDFSCPPEKQQAFLRDTETRGLAVRATRTGSKAFVLETYLHGKNIRVTIGDVRTWPLDGPAGEPRNARAEARRLQSLIDQGFDPRVLAAEQRAKANAANEQEAANLEEAKRKSIPVEQVWTEYIAARTAKWGERTLKDHVKLARPGGLPTKRGTRNTEQGPLSPLMPVKLSELSSEVVRAWLTKEVGYRPTQAALAYRYLRAFINWCFDHPQYSRYVHPDACNRRLARDTLPRQQAKKDCLQREQLLSWFTAVKDIENPVISTYLQGLLLTGARREELLSLKWSDVDFSWKSLTIRDKIEGARTIPLTPYFESLLLVLKQQNDTPPPATRLLSGKRIDNDLKNWSPSQWVFSSRRSANGRLQEPSIQHRQALETANLKGITLHGLRRSFGTLAEWVECPAGVTAQIMGHKPSAIVEKHYRARSLDMLRIWHLRIESWMLEQASDNTTQLGHHKTHLHAV